MIDERVRLLSRKTLTDFIEFADDANDGITGCIQVTASQFIGRIMTRMSKLVEDLNEGVTWEDLIKAQITELNQCILDLNMILEREGAALQ